MSGFNFNYTQTVNQARELDELARRMQKETVDKLDEICENIEASWTGEAGKAYLTYMRGVRTDLQKKAVYLHQTAEFLRSTAKKMRAADAAARSAVDRIR